jgi:hypothetical protein
MFWGRVASEVMLQRKCCWGCFSGRKTKKHVDFHSQGRTFLLDLVGIISQNLINIINHGVLFEDASGFSQKGNVHFIKDGV